MAWLKSNAADRVGSIETTVSRTAFFAADSEFENTKQLARLIINPTALGLSGLFAKATDFISRVMYIPFTPSVTGDTSNLLIKTWSVDQQTAIDTNIPVNALNHRYQLYNMGQFKVEKYFNNFADYNGYTKIELYLPFVGFVSVNPNDVVGKWLQIRLGFDALSGQGTYYVGVNDDYVYTTDNDNPPPIIPDDFGDENTRILSTHTCMLGCEIPLGSTNANEIARNLLLGAVKMAGTSALYRSGVESGAFTSQLKRKNVRTVKVKNPDTKRMNIKARIYDEGQSTRDMSKRYKYSMKNECFNTSLSALSSMHLDASSDKPNNLLGLADGSKKVYVVIYRPRIQETDEQYGKLYGYPLGRTMKLGDCEGYTEISAIHIEGTGFETITEEERGILLESLEDGIILPNKNTPT